VPSSSSHPHQQGQPADLIPRHRDLHSLTVSLRWVEEEGERFLVPRWGVRGVELFLELEIADGIDERRSLMDLGVGVLFRGSFGGVLEFVVRRTLWMETMDMMME
jgi:hypothetical protein